MIKNNNSTDIKPNKIEEKAIKFNEEFLKIKFPAIVFVISFAVSLCFFGFGLSMLISWAIFLLMIVLITANNLCKIIKNDDLNKFYLKYKTRVILFGFNIVFNVVIWVSYGFLSEFEKNKLFIHFIIISVSLFICTAWLAIYKYLSKKPFVTFSLWTFLSVVVLMPFMFFLSIYSILRELLK